MRVHADAQLRIRAARIVKSALARCFVSNGRVNFFESASTDRKIGDNKVTSTEHLDVELLPLNNTVRADLFHNPAIEVGFWELLPRIVFCLASCNPRIHNFDLAIAFCSKVASFEGK
jgi:hypothetical protein